MQHVYICMGVLCCVYATEGVWVYIYIYVCVCVCVCICVCGCYRERGVVLWILDLSTLLFIIKCTSMYACAFYDEQEC